MEKYVTVMLPYIKGVEQDDVFVSVNCRTWTIKRGVQVQVPECVAEVLENAEKADREASEFIRRNTNKG